MRANLWKRKLLFKGKTQPANSSSDHGGDERHNTEVNGRMHSGDAKIADLVGEHLQTKEKKKPKNRGGGQEQGVEMERGRGREQSNLFSRFFISLALVVWNSSLL
jgi:hypothetical protein